MDGTRLWMGGSGLDEWSAGAGMWLWSCKPGSGAGKLQVWVLWMGGRDGSNAALELAGTNLLKPTRPGKMFKLQKPKLQKPC